MKFKNQIESIVMGSFDSIHIAHQELINQVDAVVIISNIDIKYLVPLFKRAVYINLPSYFYSLKLIQNLTAKDFAEKINIDFPNLKKIVIGYDFTCGYNRECKANKLNLFFKQEIKIINEIKYQNISIHSKVIKNFLEEGNITMANKLFGREYSISGINIRGQSIGKKKIFPTINLKIFNYFLPKNGVYKTSIKIKNIWHISITFIGDRISTDNNFAIETYILNKNIEVDLNIKMDIKFISFLRKNIHFSSTELLKNQIKQDILDIS